MRIKTQFLWAGLLLLLVTVTGAALPDQIEGRPMPSLMSSHFYGGHYRVSPIAYRSCRKYLILSINGYPLSCYFILQLYEDYKELYEFYV